ncbi:MAG: YihY/virulence factor BrkB family protein [bacterium]
MKQTIWRFVVSLYNRTFVEDDCATLAASVSFYAILSFLPFVILAVSITSYFVASSGSATATIQEFITSSLPGVTLKAFDMFSGTLAQKTVYGLVGLAGLMWASMRIFSVLEIAMNRIWRPKRHRSYWESRFISLISIPAMAVFLLLSILLTTLLSVAKRTTIPLLDFSISDFPQVAVTLTYLLPIVLSTALFLLIYYFLPKKWDHFRYAFYGALVAGILWEVAKWLFDYYITHFSHMSTIYGSFTSLAILFLWVYYTSIIILLGAEVASLLESMKKEPPAGAPSE